MRGMLLLFSSTAAKGGQKRGEHGKRDDPSEAASAEPPWQGAAAGAHLRAPARRLGLRGDRGRGKGDAEAHPPDRQRSLAAATSRQRVGAGDAATRPPRKRASPRGGGG